MFTDISNRRISIDIYFSLYIAYHIFENGILNARVVINIKLSRYRNSHSHNKSEQNYSPSHYKPENSDSPKINDSLQECYKVMENQYLVTNNDSP